MFHFFVNPHNSSQTFTVKPNWLQITQNSLNTYLENIIIHWLEKLKHKTTMQYDIITVEQL